MRSLQIKPGLLFLCCWVCIGSSLHAEEPLLFLTGSDFSGGGMQTYGQNMLSRNHVNYVYAQSNGPLSEMKAVFELDRIPEEDMILSLDGRDDDSQKPCKISIKINDTVVFSGEKKFPKSWAIRRFQISENVLKTGKNTLVIGNETPEGPAGIPPWFMLSRCSIAGETYEMPVYAKHDPLVITLPKERREFPEPLSEGKKIGFPIRGTKGWNWTPEQYLDEIPVLAEYKMNFLMNCYLSLVDTQGHWENRWWEPLSEDTKESYIRIFEKSRKHGIDFCFAVHPQLASPRPLNPESQKDIDDYYSHFEWAQSQGVRWFSISLDDVSWGDQGPAIGGKQHANLVNIVFERLRKNDPEAQMIFCPVPYWGDGQQEDHKSYLTALGDDLHQDVYVFWTGDAVVPEKMTVKAAESYKNIVRHKLVIWENYPVNDSAPTLHLGPITGREPGLSEVCDGYMGNPLYLQNEVNRIPLLTCADFAWNPYGYDPNRSIGQAILHLAKTRQQQEVLKRLVEMYPGMLIDKVISTGYNSVITHYDEFLASEKPEDAVHYMQSVIQMADDLEKAFPGQFQAAIQTIRDNVNTMKSRLKE